MPSEGDVVVTRDLTKDYKHFRALDSLSISIQRGEVFGLLGPNGSGKTTLLRLIMGFLKPTFGKATVAGFDSWRQSVDVRQHVSFLPGELRMYGSMTGLALLGLLSDLRDGVGYDRAVGIADQVMGLDLSKRVKTYSTGMKQKLALAQAFSDPVEILLLDEPTSALDPSAREIVMGLVKGARDRGQTVVFSGHVLSEVEAVADRVAIMRLGRLMHVEDMHARRSLRMVLIRYDEGRWTGFPEELEATERDHKDHTVLLEHRGELSPLLQWLAKAPIRDVAIGTEDLRSLYDRFHGANVTEKELQL